MTTTAFTTTYGMSPVDKGMVWRGALMQSYHRADRPDTISTPEWLTQTLAALVPKRRFFDLFGGTLSVTTALLLPPATPTITNMARTLLWAAHTKLGLKYARKADNGKALFEPLNHHVRLIHSVVRMLTDTKRFPVMDGTDETTVQFSNILKVELMRAYCTYKHALRHTTSAADCALLAQQFGETTNWIPNRLGKYVCWWMRLADGNDAQHIQQRKIWLTFSTGATESHPSSEHA